MVFLFSAIGYTVIVFIDIYRETHDFVTAKYLSGKHV
jgi:hypothetical protein